MPIIEKINELLAFISGPLGVFVFPVVIIAAAALLIFARYSYRCFRVVLPVSGVVLGSVVGMNITGYLLGLIGTELTLPIDPKYIVGIVLATILGLLCFRFQRLAVFLAGGGLGYMVVGKAVAGFVKQFPFIQAVENTTNTSIVETVDIVVCIILAVICAFIVNKYFKPVYIFVTTIGASIFALAVLTVLLFQGSAIVDIAAMVAAGIGLVVGAVFYGIQNYETMFY